MARDAQINLRVSVYTLAAPDCDAVRYVGQTLHPEQRLAQHIARPANAALAEWIASLGSPPRMTVVETVDACEALAAEQRWIAYHRKAGAELLNDRFGDLTHQINMRMSREEADALRAHANARGLNLSDWMRLVVCAAAGRRVS